jgi:spore coat polysaccharide biosynthesis protein SpsF
LKDYNGCNIKTVFIGVGMRIGAIIQARTSSTRLPRKVLKELPYNSGIMVLEQVIKRLKKSDIIDEIIVATTTDEADEVIVTVAENNSVKSFRGNKNNVLERYYMAAIENDLDVIVRITSDCPCIDPQIVDLTIKKHLKKRSDYTSNTLIRTFPDGLDVEVFNFKTLEIAHKNAKTDIEREHVTTYIYKTAPQKFKIVNFNAPNELKSPEIRITLDTEEDYVLLCAVFDYLYLKKEFFNFRDIFNLFNEKPWLSFINKKNG